MERVQVLIDKLVQQSAQKESAAQMLLTVQLLQNELLQAAQKSAPLGSRKVAVIMPAANFAATGDATPEPVATPVSQQTENKDFENKTAIPAQEAEVPLPVEDKGVAAEAKEVHMLMMPAEEAEEVLPEQEKQPEVPKPAEPAQRDLFGNEMYTLRRPAVTLQEEAVKPDVQPVKQEVQPEVQSRYAPVPQPEPVPATPPKPAEPEPHPFDAITETPTLVQYIPPPAKETPKEINQLAATQQPSLNDRLKQEKTELAHKLKDTPVKDLRKAIGINDKFLFVNDLFRGDEAMYERSIKTINGFHILGEAEYWMNRELKVKLGWNDSKDTVQHFYNLVRRRFS